MATTEEIDAVVRRVAAKKDEWASLPPAAKLELLDRLLENLHAHADELQNASIVKRDGCIGSAEGSGAPSYEKLPKNELEILQHASSASNWLHNSMLISNWLSIIGEYYEAIVKTGKPPRPIGVRELPLEAGVPQRFLVKVGPQGLLYKTLVTYGSMELIVDGPVEQELIHKRPPGVVAVIGAGNFDGPVDLLSALFIDNKVCIYKGSPFNGPLQEPMRKVFAPLLEKSYMAFISGGASEGKTLLHHPQVGKWSIVGAETTASSIIWGSPKPPKLTDPPPVPLLDKPMIIELGNCTPWIICPGNWSRMQMKWHACSIVAAMIFNGAHICVHPQVLVTCKEWPQREEFLDLIRESLEEVHYVGCYYPDFQQRLESTKRMLEALGKKPEEFQVPVRCPLSKDTKLDSVIFATDLPEDCFFVNQEMFSPSCGEVPLDTPATIEDFLPAAVGYCNEKVHGGLSICISIKTKSPSEERTLENAIANLEYGSVHVNTDSKLSIAFPSLVWGGCPGSTIFDLKSGIGFVGNCFGYKRPVKSVIRAPFMNFTHILIAPPTSSNAAKMAKLWRRISYATFERRSVQSWWTFAGSLTKIMSAFAANL